MIAAQKTQANKDKLEKKKTGKEGGFRGISRKLKEKTEKQGKHERQVQ